LALSSNLIEEYSFKAMGGTFLLRCYPQNSFSRDEVREIFESAEIEVFRIEDELTDFRESSFNKINKYAGVQPVKVSTEILEILISAISFSKKTEGKFDISYASVGHLWREARRAQQTPKEDAIRKAQRRVDYREIQIDIDNSIVFLPHKDMRIGLGGIGKGYAVDRAYNLLIENGLINFYVNGSGDIRVHSHREAPRAWKIGVRNPFSPNPSRTMGMLQITEGAIATSGDYVNFLPSTDGKKKLHHIINPATGKPSEGVVSATVLANTTIEADTTATILMLSKPQEAVDYLNKYNLNGFILTVEGKTLLSKRSFSNFQQS
jgi:thiamine biosynthesis lipoprotein